MKTPMELRNEFEGLRPTEGFAVIGIDTYGAPDEQGPYRIGVFDTLESAYAAAQREVENGADKAYVLGADGTHLEIK